MINKKSKCGKYITHGIRIEPHEHDTIEFFLEMGEEVEQIVPSNTPHVRRPDFWMWQLQWEVKSPTTSRTRAVEDLFYSALGQSQNVIFDLRRLRVDDKKTIELLSRLFTTARRVRRLLIITKKWKLIEMKK